MKLQLAIIAISVACTMQQSLGCNSAPLPDIGGLCPTLTTLISGSGCCPDADLYNITTTAATTTTTAAATTTTTATASSSCVDLTNPSTGVSDCPRMASYCTNAIYLTLMKQQCPKTCGYCTGSATTASSTCVDLTNPSTGVSDCPRMVSYCTNAIYLTLMKQQCPKTCGYCTGSATTASSTCVDLTNPSTGVSDCPRMASYCTNAIYLTLMKQQCPKTCGYCTGSATTASSTCVDLTNPSTGVSDCPRMSAYCTNSVYLTLMRQQCPRTCGYCSGSGVATTRATSTTTCVDLTNPSTGVSDCPRMAAYCQNSAYLTLMRQQCPRTCGYCTSG